ncbi:MAG TPA: hypothetical protein VGL00_18880 [Terracidiphilus sp.]
MREVPEKNEIESEFERPSELFEPLQKIKELTKFWKTMNAITQGEPLFDYGKQRLEKEGYLGPWQFNLIQSTLSGLPGLVIPVCAHVFGIKGAEEATEADDKLAEILNSCAIPFVLMVTAYLVGKASLWKPDATKSARERAARVFLYLDGAYGLVVQLFISAILALYSLFPETEMWHRLIFYVGMAQLIVYWRTIPEKLFPALGYTEPPQSPGQTITLFGSEEKPNEAGMSRIDPPKWKYRLCVLFVIPATATAISLAIYTLSGVVHIGLKRLMG